MNNTEKLIAEFKKFPGVGTRQAERFVYYLLRRGYKNTTELADLIRDVTKNMKTCKESFQLFYSDDPTTELSPISRDTTRDRTLLLVVEKDTDIQALEKSGAYKGMYFVLGGLISVTRPDYNQYIRTDQLLARIQNGRAKDNLQEIIFGLSFTPESEHTRTLIESLIEKLSLDLKISRLGRGLSVGAELEYSDNETLAQALKTRTVGN